jgi:hypothetical protein
MSGRFLKIGGGVALAGAGYYFYSAGGQYRPHDLLPTSCSSMLTVARSIGDPKLAQKKAEGQ